MNQVKNINAVIFLTMGAMFTTMLDNATGSGIFKIAALTMDLLVITWCFLKTNSKYFFRHITLGCLFAVIILSVNTIITPYTNGFSWLLKYIGYFVFFIYGKNMGDKGYELTCNKYLLYIMILVPLITVFLFDNSDIKNRFFPNSNSFVYWGICMSLAYLLVNEHTKKSLKIAFTILIAYCLVGTSLGILVAIFLSTIMLNYKKINPIFLIIFATLIILGIAYIDIPVFERFRDVFNVFQALSLNDFINAQDVNYYELSQEVTSSGRSDNASFLWRISQWSTLLKEYFSNLLYIPFGMGLDWSMDFTGLPPHNDYVKILVEYGCIFSIIFIIGVKKVYNVVKHNMAIYLLLPIFIYHFTENLLGNFPQNVFFYTSLGYYYSLNNENTINK